MYHSGESLSRKDHRNQGLGAQRRGTITRFGNTDLNNSGEDALYLGTLSSSADTWVVGELNDHANIQYLMSSWLFYDPYGMSTPTDEAHWRWALSTTKGEPSPGTFIVTHVALQAIDTTTGDVITDQVATDTVEPRVWLPEIATNWPVPVWAGIWRSQPRPDGRIDVEFRVTDDRKLCDFRHNIFSCDMYGFNLNGCVSIKLDGSVSFIAEGLGHYGRFVSPTEFEGDWSFITPRCVDQGSWRASLVE